MALGRYRPDIDGLRAVAVLLVLVFHFDLVGNGSAGFVGVDVFFVISGFLITSIIKKDLDDNTFVLKDFYIRRIRRLFPALSAVLLLVFIAGELWLLPTDFEELSRQVLYSQTYLANFYFWQNINYFGLKADGVYLLHTWSLAVEEQFYLFYPLFLITIHKYLKKRFWLILATVLIASFSLNVIFVGIKPEATFYLFPTRAWELLIGGLIPIIHSKFSRTDFIDQIIGFVGISLILISALVINNETAFPGYFALLPTIGAACVIFSSLEKETLTSKLLSVRPFVYIGKISYSLYLFHWPLNVFADSILQDEYSLSWRLAMFVGSIIISAIIYHFVENPFRYRRVCATDKRLFHVYLASLGITGALFFIVSVTDGLPVRFPQDAVRMANYVNDKPPPMDCEFRKIANFSEKSLCKIGASDIEPTWLIYGDSHAWAGQSAFDTWLKSNRQSALFMYRHSCLPLNDVYLYKGKGECHKFNKNISAFLKDTPEITNVLLVSIWLQASAGRLSTASSVKFSKEQSIELFKRQLTATVSSMKNNGKNVYIWEPLPGAKQNVPKTMARDIIAQQVTDIRRLRVDYFSQYDFFFDALSANSQWIAGTFSPSKVLCKNEKCDVLVNNVPLYFDGNHLASSNAAFWAAQLSKQIPISD